VASRNHSADRPVLAAALSVWALLFGMLMLMLGNGLQGTVVGVRATAEGFATNTTGLIISGYFIGFLLGSWLAPRLIRQVGHLRVFAALASIASVTVLVHAMVVVPWVWVLMRLVTGFAFAGVYIVAESWLNDRVTNEHRGGLLSIYTIISYLGMTAGQLMLNVADPMLHDLFILVAMLVSLAAVPILLVVTQTPALQTWTPMGPLRLYRAAPLGAVGSCVAGVAGGALLGMGPVFAARVGMSTAQISLFMGVLIGAGALFQWPIGRTSDRCDRRRVILSVSLLGTIAAVAGAWLTMAFAERAVTSLVVVGAVLGAAVLALYPLFAAHSNDRLRPDQFVGAGSSLIMLYGVGAIGGPLLTGLFMNRLGVAGFFWLVAAALIGITLYTLLRLRRGEPLAVEDQSPWIGTPGRTPSLAPAHVGRGWLHRRSKKPVSSAPRDESGAVGGT
jgi:MFS family permease